MVDYPSIELEGIEVYHAHQENPKTKLRADAMVEDMVGRGLLDNLTIALLGARDFRPQSKLWQNHYVRQLIKASFFECQCGGHVFFHRWSTFLYGKDYGSIWYCHKCHAHVGSHGDCRLPKGYPASGEVLAWRRTVHKHFDVRWKSGEHSRTEAYKWLRESLGLPHWQCHIGKFDVERCKEALRLITGQEPLWPEF